MKPAQRWPLHPAPKKGEALSSWLHRVANCYQMSADDLLAYELGCGQGDELDTAPSMALLQLLAQRSGIELDRLRCMSLAGWVPWLLDSLDLWLPSALETYAFQFSVLLRKKRRKTRSTANWRAWYPNRPINRACPICLKDPADHAILLAWKLPLMLSCPVHGCWLESFSGMHPQYFSWENADPLPRKANQAIAEMDRRTWQALTFGYVELPRRTIQAGLWFRLLRTLLEELNTPLSLCGAGEGSIRSIWEHCGHPPRAGQNCWRPYEKLDLTVQLHMLEAAATAIDLIEAKMVSPLGEQGELFLPEPQAGFTIGQPTLWYKKVQFTSLQKALRACDEAIAEARRNPETARSLFMIAAHGRRDARTLTYLRGLFDEMGVPPEYLSHLFTEEPFA